MNTERFLMGRGRDVLSEEERAVLEDSVREVRTYPARHQLVRRGEPVTTSTILIEGVMTRYLDDREGHRQLLSIQLPGDFVDLHGFPMKRLDHDIATLTPVTVGIIDHKRLAEIMARFPRLTRMLWFSTLLDAAMHREWIFRLGRLGSAGRIAHLFCELNERLETVGLAKDGVFALPVTQADLAEACGVTGVHVNRTLRALREQGLMTFAGGQATILNRRSLAAAGEFDPDYLYGSRSDWLELDEMRSDA